MKNKIYIVVLVLLVLAGTALYLLKSESETLKKTVNPVLPTGSPNTGSQLFSSDNLGFSFMYPKNYSLKDVTKPNTGKLLSLVLSSSSGSSSESMIVFVFPLKNKFTLKDWVNSYVTTSDSSTLKAKNEYVIDQANGIAYTSIGTKEAAVFTQGNKTSIDAVKVTLFLTKTSVIFVGQQASVIGPDYDLVTSSISFK
jgi:hypothetical protein